MKFKPFETKDKRKLSQLETDIEKLDTIIHKVERIRNKMQGEVNKLCDRRERTMHPEKYCESCGLRNVSCYCQGC